MHLDVFINSIFEDIQVFEIDPKKYGGNIAQLAARFNLFHEVLQLFEKDLRRLERELKLE